ncbi:MAG TPA: hypothetical protein VIS10_16585 [Anaerolineales bacterium]
MWNRIARQVQSYSSAVLTFVEGNGYPFSVRCDPQYDRSQQVFRLHIPNQIALQSGPAGLLCHQHDKNLWNLKSMVLRGILEEDDKGWFFRPLQFIPGMGGFFGYVRFVAQGRRLARNYLERRGLDRPTIPWAEYATIVKLAKKDKFQIE